jgi:hypothetical protein
VRRREDGAVFLHELRALADEDLVGRAHLSPRMVAIHREHDGDVDEANTAAAEPEPKLVVEQTVQVDSEHGLMRLERGTTEERGRLNER